MDSIRAQSQDEDPAQPEADNEARSVCMVVMGFLFRVIHYGLSACDVKEDDAGNLAPPAAAPEVAPMPDASIPDGAMPDAPIPDGAMPDAPIRDGPMPDAPIRDGPMPDAPTRDGAMPDAPIRDLEAGTPFPATAERLEAPCCHHAQIPDALDPMPTPPFEPISAGPPKLHPAPRTPRREEQPAPTRRKVETAAVEASATTTNPANSTLANHSLKDSRMIGCGPFGSMMYLRHCGSKRR